MSLSEIKEYLMELTPRAVLIHKDGFIIESTFPKSKSSKTVSVLKEIGDKIEVGKTYTSMPWVFFRVTENIFLVLSVTVGKTKYMQIFNDFAEKFREKLEENVPRKVGDLIKTHTFAMTRSIGPEPIATYFVKDGLELDDQMIWKYCMSSLMILVNQTSVKKRDILTFHPFLQRNELGLVFLFKVHNENARGNAYDASLFSIIDYDNRAFVYDLHLRLEEIYSTYAKRLEDTFNEHYGNDIDAPIEDPNPFIDILKELQDELNELPLHNNNDNADLIRDKMIRSISDLLKQL